PRARGGGEACGGPRPGVSAVTSRRRGRRRRRPCLRAGTLALGGLSLPDVLAARGSAPAVPDTSVILFWMWGEPSHLETFDPKPDAPGEYRGPFRPTRTAVPRLGVCALFPQL